MKRHWITVTALAALAILAAPGSCAGAEEQRQFDFYKIGKLLNAGLTHQERTELGLRYLREEISRPTGAYAGLGGPISHEYVLAQIVGATAQAIHSRQVVDQEILWKEYQAVPGGEYRDMLGLALAISGDRRGSDHAAAYLRNIKHAGVLRALAARSLGEIQETRHIPLLVQVMLQDQHYLANGSRDAFERPIIRRTFPVRQGAREALRRLEAKGIDIGDQARQGIKSAILQVNEPTSEPEIPRPAKPGVIPR